MLIYSYKSKERTKTMKTTTLSQDKIKRIKDGIKQAEGFIKKEMAYSEDLRDAKYIADYTSYIARMNAILNAGEIAA
mgnify:FL=1